VYVRTGGAQPELLTLVIAADELRRRFGDRLDDAYRSGKRLFRRALRQRHQATAEQADALCDALERAGMLTFDRERRRTRWTIDPFAR
jgi:hypothetical protein